MIKRIALILIATISLYSQDLQEQICSRVKTLLKESAVLYRDFNDSKSALILLKNSEFRSILYFREISCLSKREYIDALNQYSLYLLNSNNSYEAERFLKRFIKKYPKNPLAYYYLGEFYKKRYFQNQSRFVKYRQEAFDNFKRYIKLAKEQGLKPKKEAIEFVKSGGFKRAKSTWGDFLKPDIPKNRFRVFYLDRSKKDKVVATNTVDSVSIHYSWDKFHNINSKNFSAYWVGEFEFNETKKMQINIAQSWAKTRVIIDGYIVYEGENSSVSIPFEFKKGTHKIEVEYINNWHTTNFSLSITPFVKVYDFKELKEALKRFDGVDFELWSVGIYESRNSNNSITLNLKESKKPIILVLGSYETVKWIIKNPYKDKILAVIVGRSRTISQIRGDIDGAKVFHTKLYLKAYALYPKCKCIKRVGVFDCNSGSSLARLNHILKRLLKKQATGFSGKYGAKSLKVPEVVLDKDEYQKIKEAIEDIKRRRKECQKSKDTDFDSMFKK